MDYSPQILYRLLAIPLPYYVMITRMELIVNNTAKVATPSGQQEVSSQGNLNPGDVVTVKDGMAIKKQRGGNVQVRFV